VVACGMSALLNIYLFIPLYFPAMENVWQYIVAGAIPMTAIKCGMNAVVVYFIYPFLSKILHK